MRNDYVNDSDLRALAQIDREKPNARRTHHLEQSTPLFTGSGYPCHLQHMFRGRSAFLIGGGSSLKEVDISLLKRPGCLTMSMNNAICSIRTDLWVSVDAPHHFVRSVWLDSKIMKFTPLAHYSERVFDSDTWCYTRHRACECPNAFFYLRSDRFEIDTYLSEQVISWGNHASLGGGRSVMLAAIKLLYYLGIRTVYLVGVDFGMDRDAPYHFEQKRDRAAIRGNNTLYKQLIQHFTNLAPVFDARGFKLFNCNPKSNLTLFPLISLEDAVTQCREDLPPDMTGERSAGLYDEAKPQPKATGSPNRDANRAVVIAAEKKCEWLLQWWHRNYSAHNDHPVHVIDLGLTQKTRTWCESIGTVFDLPQEFPRFRKGWFYKPAAFVLSDADEILFLDLDCEIRGSLLPVFEVLDDKPLLAKDRYIMREYRDRFEPDNHFNTGVIASRRVDPLMLDWGQMTLDCHTQYRSDQEIFNEVIKERKGAVDELPQPFNRLRLDGDDPSAIIMHWTGEIGKEEIRRQMALSG